MEPKIEIFNFEVGEKLDYYFQVKFHCESNGDSLDALKQCLDSEMGHKGLIKAKNRKILNLR